MSVTQFEPYLDVPSLEKCRQIALMKRSNFREKSEIVDGRKLISFNYYSAAVEQFQVENCRLNLRGISFDEDGNLVCLPFPKFFNVGENEMTQNLDMDHPQFIFDKMDGSLILFFKWPVSTPGEELSSVEEKNPDEEQLFMFHPEILLRSQNSCTSGVAIAASKLLKDQPGIVDFVEKILNRNITPIFEYIGPENLIVLEYEKSDLVFLGGRQLETGEIFPPHKDFFTEITDDITLPDNFTTKASHQDHMEREDREGVVIMLKSGQYVKMKTKSYFARHKFNPIALQVRPKLIAEKCLDNSLDDWKGNVYQFGSQKSYDAVCDLERKFLAEVDVVVEFCTAFYDNKKHLTERELANELQQNGGRSLIGFVMKIHKNVSDEAVMKDVRKFVARKWKRNEVGEVIDLLKAINIAV